MRFLIRRDSVTFRSTFKSSHPEVVLGKGVLKICSKFTAEHPCRSTISIKFQSNLIEITLRHGCSPVNLQLISRTPAFTKNTSGRLLLYILSFTNLEKTFLSGLLLTRQMCNTIRRYIFSNRREMKCI